MKAKLELVLRWICPNKDCGMAIIEPEKRVEATPEEIAIQPELEHACYWPDSVLCPHCLGLYETE